MMCDESYDDDGGRIFLVGAAVSMVIRRNVNVRYGAVCSPLSGSTTPKKFHRDNDLPSSQCRTYVYNQSTDTLQPGQPVKQWYLQYSATGSTHWSRAQL